MQEVNWLTVFNSSISFALLLAIAVGVWFLVLKTNWPSKTHTRKSK